MKKLQMIGKKWQLLNYIILFLLGYYFLFPISKKDRQKFAREEFFNLVDEDKIDTALFEGPIEVKENNKEWFEWFKVVNNDSLIFRINIPKIHLFPINHYMTGKEENWSKVYETKPGWKKTKGDWN